MDLLATKHDDRICQYITHIELTTLSNYIWMFFQHQPANVGKEKSPVAIMRIRIRIRIFMMHFMISNPVVRIILKKIITKKTFSLSAKTN